MRGIDAQVDHSLPHNLDRPREQTVMAGGGAALDQHGDRKNRQAKVL